MRKRLLAVAAMLAMMIGVLVAAASPASADCGGHSTHPDVYSSGGISWGDGTNIRSHPHLECSRVGQGFPGQGIDVHCAVNAGGAGHLHWLYVRNTSTGTNGWARQDALNHPRTVAVPDCNNPNVVHEF